MGLLRKIFLVIGLVLFSASSFAKKPDSAFGPEVWKTEAELREEATHSNEAKKVDIYLKLARLFKDSERELQYLDSAEVYATRVKSNKDLGTVMLMRVEHHSIYGIQPDFQKEATRAKAFMESQKDIRLANIEHILIKRSIDEGHTRTALDAAEKMLSQATEDKNLYREAYANFSIGLIYSAVNQPVEAVNALEKSIVLMDFQRNDFPFTDALKARLELLEVQYSLGRHLESLETCSNTEKLLKEYIDGDSGELQADANCKSMGLFIQSYYIFNYVDMKEFAKAAQHMKRAEDYIYPMIGLDIETYNEACASYYLGVGDFARAISYADKSVNAFHEAELLPYYLDALELKTKILAESGKWEEAYSNLEYIKNARDSIGSSRFAMQISELHAIYEIDKIEAEKNRQQSVLVFSILFCLLFLVIIVIYVIYSHRLEVKNKILYEQINSRIISSKQSVSVLKMTPEEELSKEMQIFKRITLLMEEGHPFTDPTFNRSHLAKMLGTNEKYIADAIKEGAGVTIATYITDIRLEYSLTLLAEENESTLDDIGRDSGFGSYSSFFRAFQKKYSISPSEYRNIQLKNNSATK